MSMNNRAIAARTCLIYDKIAVEYEISACHGENSSLSWFVFAAFD